MAELMKNAVKEMMKEGKVALGMIARVARSGDIARIAKTSGHDFVFVDGQHALYSVETTGHIAQAALGCGVVPMARVRSCDDPQRTRTRSEEVPSDSKGCAYVATSGVGHGERG